MNGVLRRPYQRILARLCAASRVGAQIRSESSRAVALTGTLASRFKIAEARPLKMALHGGDDYDTPFHIPPRNVKKLSKAPDSPSLTPIGEVTRRKSITLIAGR